MSDTPRDRGPEELSTAEKILRVQDLWDEIARSPREVELTEAQRREAERRLLEHERTPPGVLDLGGSQASVGVPTMSRLVRLLPESRELVARRTRRVLLRRFPHFTLHFVDDREILVTAIFHAHRDPQRWSNRVREVVSLDDAFAIA